jgi:anthranilate synthase/aminodeoxychorismate synthase-like glutamine amidotransferase
MILLIDNYDSFVFNLARYFQRLGQETYVVRNDAIDAGAVRTLAPSAIVLSPGPCTPNEAGCSLELVRSLHREVPILGVCLGHQVIGQAFGGRIVRAIESVHGRASRVQHCGRGIFAGIPNPLTACRYHSLAIERESLPKEFSVTATLDDGTIMAIEHRELPVFGVQFHPESVLTSHGYLLLANFLRLCGHEPAKEPEVLENEIARYEASYSPPNMPVTF